MERGSALSLVLAQTLLCHCLMLSPGVLIHCGAGVSRSATLVLAYLMRRFSWNAAKARKHCQERRSLVNPNDGFWRSLCALEAQLGIADRCGAEGGRCYTIWWRPASILAIYQIYSESAPWHSPRSGTREDLLTGKALMWLSAMQEQRQRWWGARAGCRRAAGGGCSRREGDGQLPHHEAARGAGGSS